MIDITFEINGRKVSPRNIEVMHSSRPCFNQYKTRLPKLLDPHVALNMVRNPKLKLKAVISIH